MTSFQEFGLADPISRALKEENYETPTPIQAQTIPIARRIFGQEREGCLRHPRVWGVGFGR